jgi:formylglycine-generating enzyme
MVRIAGGTFTMGSPANEPERRKYEGPRSSVHVASFAISETEVTRDQYAAFVRATNRAADGGCYTHGDGTSDISVEVESASWRAPAFEQTSDHPVVCVSWEDAKEYARWVSGKTGHHYRLPTEAEWEYAARAGTTSPFFWGDGADNGCGYMNGGDPSLLRALPTWQKAIEKSRRDGDAGARLLDCDDGSAFTSAVARYKPNAFGLHDTTGNVWEWVEDCARDELPTSGAAHDANPCEFRRVRGGSWDDYPEDLRSARRARLQPSWRRNDTGFRLARSLQ